ncbi:Uncharacterized protein Fot_37198 [Forsythia ovata]|uniref:Uncharacterized protein n=1 Tax=Forsythia ovata TaxID=205694 RepID=A0ABD1SRK9_9LAMI
MENMSVEHLRALKEQADLEFNFFQDTTSAPPPPASRSPPPASKTSPSVPKRTEYLDSQEYFDNTREWLHLWGVFLSGIEGADSTTVFHVASNVQTARGTLVLNTDDVIRE